MGDLVAYWAVVEALGLIGVPLAALLFRRVPGRGLTLARPLALLLAAYPVWLLASLDVAPYGPATALGGIALVTGLSAAVVLRRPRGSRLSFAGETDEERRTALRLFGAGEVLFALAFLAVVLLRLQVPDVWMNEKPMNMAFINAIERTDWFPPHDPWASGLELNYYYLGHYLVAFVVGLTGVGPGTAYNLSFAFVVAMGAGGVFGVAATLHLAARRGAWRAATAAGLVAVLFALVLGNVAGVLDFLRDPVRPAAFDFRQAGEVIPFTLNEFPFSSVLIANLHANVIAIPFQLLALLVALQLTLAGPARGRAAATAEVVFGAVVVGSLYAINSWSYPPALGIAVAALALWAAHERTRRASVRAALVAVALVAGSLVAFAPFHLELEAAVDGIGRTVEQTPTLDFVRYELQLYALPAWVLGGVLLSRVARLARGRALAWAALPALALVAVPAPAFLAKAILVGAVLALMLHAALGARESSSDRFFWLIAAAGLIAATVGEFVYVRDHADGSPFFRLTTVLKVGYQAWVLLALAAAYALMSSVSGPAGPYRRAWVAGALVLVLATAGWSAIATGARLSRDEAGPTLDGFRWLERKQPGDAAAIEWLRDRIDGTPVVLEAEGDGKLYSRIATFTGLPTVLVQASHEKQWNHPAGRRPRDVATIYRTRDGGEARRLLERYDVRYVVVGSVERDDHPRPGLEKFSRLGTVVFDRAGTRVYRVGPVETALR